MDFIGFLVTSGAAATASAAAYVKLAPSSWKDAVKADLKAAPAAAKLAVDRKIADMRVDSIKTVTNPTTGISQYVNEEREVVELRENIRQAEQLGYQVDTNPNRDENPRDGLF